MARARTITPTTSRTGTTATAGGSRPAAYTVEELAALLSVRPAVVVAMLEARGDAFFPGAWVADDGGWQVPDRAVRRYLDRRVEPLFTFQDVADFLGVHKVTVQKAAADWLKGDRNGFETVALLLPGCGSKRTPRITLTELQRHVQPVRRVA